MGGTFVAEEWPENRRRMGAGFMHTGYYVGIFLAALANYGIGSHYGWRAMFIVGGLPALLLAWLRHGVVEPAAWKNKESVVRSWAVWRPFAILFSSAWRRRTILNSLFMLASICGLWAGTVYVPAAITALAESGRPRGPGGRTTGFLGRHAGFIRYDSRLPGHALAGGAPWPARCAGRFLYPDDGVYRAHVRQRFSTSERSRSVVFLMSFLPGLRRGEFRRLHALAS